MPNSNYKYKEEYCQQLIDHMSTGLSFETFCAEINVAPSTLYKWAVEIPEFEHAKKIAFAKAQKFYEQRLVAKISGQDIKNVDSRKIDTSCLIFALKTRFHKTYGEKHQHSLEITEFGFVGDDD